MNFVGVFYLRITKFEQPKKAYYFCKKVLEKGIVDKTQYVNFYKFVLLWIKEEKHLKILNKNKIDKKKYLYTMSLIYFFFYIANKIRSYKKSL